MQKHYIAFYTKKGKEDEYRIKAASMSSALEQAYAWATRKGYAHEYIEVTEVY